MLERGWTDGRPHRIAISILHISTLLIYTRRIITYQVFEIMQSRWQPPSWLLIRGLSRLSHQGGGISVVSGGGRVRGEDLNLSVILMYIVSIISSIWSTDNHLTNRKIFFFKAYCSVHNSNLHILVHRTPPLKGGGVHCAWSGGIQLFSGGEYSSLWGRYINPCC